MADMRVKKDSKLVFRVNPADDCKATVRRGFEPASPVADGADLPTLNTGVWLVVAADNQNRALDVRLEGTAGFAQPVTAPGTPGPRVRLTYEVYV